MAEKSKTTRTAGRPAIGGTRRQYVVTDDVHEWIMAHGGGKYITDTMRCVRVTSGGKGAVTDYAMCILRAGTCFDFEVDLTEPYADLGLKARDMILSEVKEPETYHVYKEGTWKDGVFCNIGSLAISSPSECPEDESKRRYYRPSGNFGDYKCIPYKRVKAGDYCLVNRYIDDKARVVGVLAQVEK
jgi:hypothetical protein|nr:MAG TPA: hypothetical protein [Caudoviricetes sp.]